MYMRFSLKALAPHLSEIKLKMQLVG